MLVFNLFFGLNLFYTPYKSSFLFTGTKPSCVLNKNVINLRLKFCHFLVEDGDTDLFRNESVTKKVEGNRCLPRENGPFFFNS